MDNLHHYLLIKLYCWYSTFLKAIGSVHLVVLKKWFTFHEHIESHSLMWQVLMIQIWNKTRTKIHSMSWGCTYLINVSFVKHWNVEFHRISQLGHCLLNVFTSSLWRSYRQLLFSVKHGLCRGWLRVSIQILQHCMLLGIICLLLQQIYIDVVVDCCDWSDIEMKDAVSSENATDTETYANSTEDDVSTFSQRTRNSEHFSISAYLKFS